LEANEKWAILHAIGIQNGQYSTPSAYKMQFIFDGRKINCILYADEYYPLFIIGLVSSNISWFGNHGGHKKLNLLHGSQIKISYGRWTA
jgi:hypothetical protein